MKFTKLVIIAVVLGTASASAVVAQTRPGSQPSEFPPASYKGKQYVDSAGCVFIRAGIDGTVSWVPRVTRKRIGVCGFRPTFAGQVTAAPEPVQTAAVAQITAPPVAAAPKPVPARVVRAAPAPKPAAKVVRQIAPSPAPIVEKTVQPVPVLRTAAAAPEGQAACVGASAISSRYLQRGKFAVRCGPQTAPIVGARISAAPAPRGVILNAPVQAAAAARTVQVAPNARIVPRHVAVSRVNTTNVHVPHGYKTVWTDGRLNPKRAEQSLAGHKGMQVIWTSTVPRRLINQADGMDVTASVALVYPYTDYAAQQRQLGQVTIVQRNGQTFKRIVRNVAGVFSPEPRQARVATLQRQPTYSSRSTTPKAAPKATANRTQPKAEAAGNGFVQVGAFADAAAAQRLAKQVQRMGLPVRVGRYARDGQTTRLVIAGPFNGTSDVNRAISRLRGAGMNAFAR